MCGCEPGFICPQCAGTRLADDYLDDERETLSEAVAAALERLGAMAAGGLDAA